MSDPLPAVLPHRRVLPTVAVSVVLMYIPPPLVSALLPEKVQFVTAGLASEMDIPPPLLVALPPVTVKPESRVFP